MTGRLKVLCRLQRKIKTLGRFLELSSIIKAFNEFFDNTIKGIRVAMLEYVYSKGKKEIKETAIFKLLFPWKSENFDIKKSIKTDFGHDVYLNEFNQRALGQIQSMREQLRKYIL
ncbi:MAG: hypothetical protein K0R24_2119 [Gammaproteobacteria bacterium]|nr:hypothetical protein [Gammaproteobacteria bacterium]